MYSALKAKPRSEQVRKSAAGVGKAGAGIHKAGQRWPQLGSQWLNPAAGAQARPLGPRNRGQAALLGGSQKDQYRSAGAKRGTGNWHKEERWGQTHDQNLSRGDGKTYRLRPVRTWWS